MFHVSNWRGNVWICLCLPLFATACSHERVITKPEIVTVVETRTIPVPVDLTQEAAPTPIPEGLSYGEALSRWAMDRETIRVLNARLRAIAGLSDELVEN